MGRSLLQLSEVLNGTNHLAGVGVLVVVPRNDLNVIGVVVDLSDHGLGGIEQGAVLHADNVRRNDRILVVAEALGSSSLHSSVDSFLGDILALNDSNQNGGGAGGNGNALSGADQLAVQFGDNQADSLGSAGGVRNDVLSTSTSAAQVALTLRAVQDHLVAGVSMNGGHDAGNDRESLVQGVGHRSQAVGGAGSSRDNLVILGQGLLVDRVDDGLQVVAGRSRDNDLLSASSDVSHALLFAGVEAGALQNNVNADLAPRAILSVLNGIDLDLLAIDDDGILGSFDGALYWLARMVEGGEDPAFIARRLVISAAEDIGLANPNALLLANTAFDAVMKIGWPEGRIPLAEATVYLATSPKSNSAYEGINSALELVRSTGNLPVPLHLRNAPTKLMKQLGYGKDYKYAHAYQGNFVNQQFLPDEIKNSRIWHPQNNAQEVKLKERMQGLWGDKFKEQS